MERESDPAAVQSYRIGPVPTSLTGIRYVTLDCAGTLVDVRWNPAQLAVVSAHTVGIRFRESEAAELYNQILTSRWPEFRELNLLRSRQVCDAFWMSITEDWAARLGIPPHKVPHIYHEAERRLFGFDSEIFRVFEDVQPTLEGLKERGIKLAVLSNWDVSLHRVLAMFGLSEYMEFAIASLEEGFEKPDPRIFALALEKFAAEPSEALHIGDHPMDDLHGARQAGMAALLVDRTQRVSGSVVMNRLDEVLNRF